jgi:hypothetical protein
MHNFKRHETKKYRDGVCLSLNCKFAPIDPDGNCFFAAVSTAMAHFYDQPLCITAQDCRARVVAWLNDCKVRALPPTTTTHHHSDTPPPTIHHHTPLHHHLRPTTQTHTPLYTSLLQDGQHGDVGEACRVSMIDELAYPLVQSVGNKGKTKLMDVNTIDNNLQDSVSDKDEYDMGASNCAAAMCMRCMCMRNSAYLTEARERDRRKGNLSTRNNNNLHDSVSDKDEYDMGASNCAAAVWWCMLWCMRWSSAAAAAVVYTVVYVVVYAVVYAVV